MSEADRKQVPKDPRLAFWIGAAQVLGRCGIYRGPLFRFVLDRVHSNMARLAEAKARGEHV